jgi:hypothetical protein
MAAACVSALGASFGIEFTGDQFRFGATIVSGVTVPVSVSAAQCDRSLRVGAREITGTPTFGIRLKARVSACLGRVTGAVKVSGKATNSMLSGASLAEVRLTKAT